MALSGMLIRGRWYLQVAAKGTLGANVDLTPTAGSDKIFDEVLIQAPLAATDATLKIYNDSVAAGNLQFDGYMMNRDSNGAIPFPGGINCTTKLIVLVSGSTDDIFAVGRYH